MAAKKLPATPAGETTDVAPIRPPALTREPELWIHEVTHSVPAYTPMHPGLLGITGAVQHATSDAQQSEALRLAALLTGEANRARDHYQPYTQAASKLHKSLVAMRDSVAGIYEAEFTRLKKVALDYHLEQQRLVREEEQRRVREAQERAEIERRRIAMEAQAEANRLVQQGQFAAAQQVAEQAQAQQVQVRVEPVVVPTYQPSAANQVGVKVTKTYRPVYGNLHELVWAAAHNPAAFMPYISFNEAAVKAAANAMGLALQLPGVTVEEVQGLAVSAR